MATRDRTAHRRTTAALVATLAATLCGAAHAEEAKPKAVAADFALPQEITPKRDWENEPAKRRSGFVAGIMFGAGLSSIAGFPNDVRKIGYERHYTETGARPAATGTLWIGGALTDWFTFGIGFGGGRLLATGDDTATAGGILFHVDVFPLFPLGGKLRDLGATLEAGTGTATVVAKDEKTKLVDSGAASLIGGGVFWEGVRFWKFRGGPFLMGNYMWSDSARRPGIFAGWRMTLYTGPSSPAP